MNVITICASLLGLLLVGLVIYGMRRLRPQMAGYAAQRMCPSCGLITPRAKAACLECGKVFIVPTGRS